jgi:hypothetical protein
MTTTDDNDKKDRAIQILARHQRWWTASSVSLEETLLPVTRHDFDLAQLTSIYACLRAVPTTTTTMMKIYTNHRREGS